MGETWHYLALDILLYILPLLALLRWARGQQLREIAWFDIGKDTPFLNGIVVVDDCTTPVSGGFSSLWRKKKRGTYFLR
jgi:hypothetical protein